MSEVETDIDVVAVGAFDREPIHELGGRVGGERGQHRAPSGDRQRCAAFQRADQALDALADLRFQRAGADIERLGKSAHEDGGWVGRAARAQSSAAAAGDQAIDRCTGFGFQGIGRATDQRAPSRGCAPGPGNSSAGPRGSVLSHGCAISAGNARCRLSGSSSEPKRRVLRRGDQLLGAAFEPARAAACCAAFGAQQPSPQVRGFEPAQLRRECRIRCLEDVMAFVEDVPRRPRGIVKAAQGRLRHHKRVVRDHDLGVTRAAHRALDEAFLVVRRAGGVDAIRRAGR